MLPLKKLLFPDATSKIGLLPPATIGSVVAAYEQADWYWWRMRDEATTWAQALRSGSDEVKSRASEKVMSQHDELAEKTREKIERAIAELEPMSGQASPRQLRSITRALDYDEICVLRNWVRLSGISFPSTCQVPPWHAISCVPGSALLPLLIPLPPPPARRRERESSSRVIRPSAATASKHYNPLRWRMTKSQLTLIFHSAFGTGRACSGAKANSFGE